MEPIVLSDGDRARIRDAIVAAEARTSGEIFTVVARISDDYRFIPTLWATLAALAVPLPLVWFTVLPAGQIYLIQLAVFIALALLFSLPPLRLWLVPRFVKERRAHALALQQFLAHGLHLTEERTGILIFVSLGERYAEIVADTGIDEKVEKTIWKESVEGLVAEIRRGRLADGLVATIGHLGAVLAAHFPPRPRDVNELSDDLILL